MAALQGYVDLPSTSLATATQKTVVQITAPTNQRVKVLAYGFYFDGTVNSAVPVQIQIGRISTTTSTTYTSATPSPVEPECTETFQGTYQIQNSSVTEPTYTKIMKTFTVHPQLGYEYLAPLGQEDIVPGGGIMGINCNAPASVDVRGYVRIEE
jgi:hypothetical protein